MTKCDGCGTEVGPLFCGHCREKIKKDSTVGSTLIPVLFFDNENKVYHAGCRCFECPWNKNGVCVTGMASIKGFTDRSHEFDGDNCIHQVCG